MKFVLENWEKHRDQIKPRPTFPVQKKKINNTYWQSLPFEPLDFSTLKLHQPILLQTQTPERVEDWQEKRGRSTCRKTPLLTLTASLPSVTVAAEHLKLWLLTMKLKFMSLSVCEREREKKKWMYDHFYFYIVKSRMNLCPKIIILEKRR